jgi:hypothetical protein
MLDFSGITFGKRFAENTRRTDNGGSIHVNITAIGVINEN